MHLRIIVKNIGWANQNIGAKVVKSDKCMGVSQLLGAPCSGCPTNDPKSTPMSVCVHIFKHFQQRDVTPKANYAYPTCSVPVLLSFIKLHCICLSVCIYVRKNSDAFPL